MEVTLVALVAVVSEKDVVLGAVEDVDGGVVADKARVVTTTPTGMLTNRFESEQLQLES